MKKVVEASVGGIKFTMEEDAYVRLKNYLKRFESTIPDPREAREIMEDVEMRIAEIFQKEQKFPHQVISMELVQIVINHLGEVDSKEENKDFHYTSYASPDNEEYTKGPFHLYRSVDDKMIAGVCGGLAAYFKIDTTLIRIAFVLLAFAYGSAIIAYIIIWLIAPSARTIAQKLEMQGYAPTAENIRKYTSRHK